MSKPGKVLKALCKKLGVRLTVKRGKKRIYKSVAVLKRQCANKKKKKVKRKRKFGEPTKRSEIREMREKSEKRKRFILCSSKEIFLILKIKKQRNIY